MRSQGPVIEVALYKIFRTKAFGRCVNQYGMALTPVVTIDRWKLINLDFPDLDIRKDIYGYDEEARRSVCRHLAEAMMRVLELPLLTWLKSSDNLLLTKEILSAKVDVDTLFKDLGEGVTCSLASLAAKATPDVILSKI